ncbi:hypothetical protein FMN50_04235 [Rhodobacterales bacterium]|nr:hypothetical protein FMN50_04235 [Rhodobacterales bacterium]
MQLLRRTLTGTLAALVLGVGGGAMVPAAAKAEIFYCESTKTKSGTAKYCNFLLFDRNFTRHKQIVLAQGAHRDVAINGKYDLFCVLVQNHRNVPNNLAYRTQQCKKTDTGKEYKVPIRAMNMRRGHDGFSSNTVRGFLPPAW